jgi:hypothetical protein
MTFKGKEFKGHGLHGAGRARGLHRLHLCVEVCPAKDKANPRTRRSRWRRSAAARRERENFAFFLDLPRGDRTKVKRSTSRARSS